MYSSILIQNSDTAEHRVLFTLVTHPNIPVQCRFISREFHYIKRNSSFQKKISIKYMLVSERHKKCVFISDIPASPTPTGSPQGHAAKPPSVLVLVLSCASAVGVLCMCALRPMQRTRTTEEAGSSSASGVVECDAYRFCVTTWQSTAVCIFLLRRIKILNRHGIFHSW